MTARVLVVDDDLSLCKALRIGLSARGYDVVVARTAEDKRVEIKLKTDNSHVVKVSIRVGIFGDSRISEAVLEKIKANL